MLFLKHKRKYILLLTGLTGLQHSLQQIREKNICLCTTASIFENSKVEA